MGQAAMIIVDRRVGSKDLFPLMQRMMQQNKLVSLGDLEFGDVCFEGNGPKGVMAVGVERKTLSDMLNCIDDARYAGHQRPGMLAMYQHNILMIEGVWKPDTITGYLMECVRTLTWQPFRYRTRFTMYSKLFRFLLTVQLAGTSVIITRDQEHTAYNIVECFHYFQKRWEDHTSLMEKHKLNIPTLLGKPPLRDRWAAELEGIGVKKLPYIKGQFRTAFELANSSEEDWLTMPGVGVNTARSIIKQIHETE